MSVWADETLFDDHSSMMRVILQLNTAGKTLTGEGLC
jgi:hypothetical protein